MENVLLSRKDWSNAAAFVEFNPETNKVRVYGKFYENDGWRRRGYGGPSTDWLETIPSELVEEAKNLGWNVPKSQKMKDFCEEIFAKAKEVEPWFGY